MHLREDKQKRESHIQDLSKVWSEAVAAAPRAERRSCDGGSRAASPAAVTPQGRAGPGAPGPLPPHSGARGATCQPQPAPQLRRLSLRPEPP